MVDHFVMVVQAGSKKKTQLKKEMLNTKKIKQGWRIGSIFLIYGLVFATMVCFMLYWLYCNESGEQNRNTALTEDVGMENNREVIKPFELLNVRSFEWSAMLDELNQPDTDSGEGKIVSYFFHCDFNNFCLLFGILQTWLKRNMIL